MDHVSTSFDVIDQIYATLTFIRQVAHDSDDSERKKSLEALLVFLEAFSAVCYNAEAGLLRDGRVHDALSRDTERSLYSLKKCLAAYSEVWGCIDVTENFDQLEGDSMASLNMSAEYGRKRWRDGMKERAQVWRKLAQPVLNEVLFGQKELNTVIKLCEGWIYSLRHTLEIILLTIGPPKTLFPMSPQVANLGIVEVLDLQRRAASNSLSSTHFNDNNALPGVLHDTVGITKPFESLAKTVYKDGDDEVDVIAEVAPNSETPTQDLCHLTWLLQALSQQRMGTKNGPYALQTLICMGFLDDPINKRGLILYRCPQSHPWASKPPNLHDLLTRGDAAKPSLNSRFNTARAIAGTILATHSSGWMHQRLHSKNLLMIPRSLNDSEPSPFVVGWGIASPPEGRIFDLEPNLYQHKDRFGKASAAFETTHDIYSLGVVLLELGLWKPMSVLFARRIAKMPRFDESQQRNLYHRINSNLLDLANSIELKKEMGQQYAELVVQCLLWHHRDPVKGMIEFRKQVVDALTALCVL